MKFDPLYVFQSIPPILGAFPMTVLIWLLALIVSSLFAVPLTMARLRGRGKRYRLAGLYLSFFRGTPVLVQLFLVYFGLPKIFEAMGIDISEWSRLLFIVAAFSLNSSAFLSEMFRSSYLSVDRGQHEAALSIGMTGFQKFRRVILPQAFVVALPNIGNSLIGMFKETSIAFTIGVVDLLAMTKTVSSRGYGAHQLECYLAVALIYWIVCFLLENGVSWAERLTAKPRVRGKKVTIKRSAA